MNPFKINLIDTEFKVMETDNASKSLISSKSSEGTIKGTIFSKALKG
jgi:hypothetical protein